MTWQILIAISIATSAIATLIQRVLLSRDRVRPAAYAVVYQCSVGLVLLVIALIRGWVWPDFGRFWLPIVATSVFFPLGHILYGTVLREKPAAAGAVYWATANMWIVMLSYFIFREHIASWAVLGIVLLLAGVFLISYDRRALGLDRMTGLGLLAGLFYGVASTSWIYVSRHAELFTWNALSFLAPGVLLVFVHPQRRQLFSGVNWSRVAPRMGALAVLFAVLSLASLGAYQRGNASIVAAVSPLNVVLVALMGAAFLGERKHFGKTLVAATLCAIGAATLSYQV